MVKALVLSALPQVALQYIWFAFGTWDEHGKLERKVTKALANNSVLSGISVVLPKKVDVNLCESPEDKMIKFLPSATQTRNTRGNIQQGHHSLHSSAQRHFCLFVCLSLFVKVVSLPRYSRAKGRRKETRRRRVKGNISTSGHNQLLWHFRGSKAMSCWLFNKLGAYAAVCA